MSQDTFDKLVYAERRVAAAGISPSHWLGEAAAVPTDGNAE